MNDAATRSLGVIVVDDQAAFREAASAVIDLIDDMHVVAEATDAASAITAVAKEPCADVAIVDLNLGADSGIDVCRQLRALRPELAVVIVSTTAPEDLPSDIHSCGASGFISKSRFGIASLTEVVGSAGHLR